MKTLPERIRELIKNYDIAMTHEDETAHKYLHDSILELVEEGKKMKEEEIINLLEKSFGKADSTYEGNIRCITVEAWDKLIKSLQKEKEEE